jgi:hypothetical protein
MRRSFRALMIVLAAFALFAAACGDDDSSSEDSAEDEDHADEMRTVSAPVASIAVDGDASDWADIEGLSFTMEAIDGESVDPKQATVKFAHDDEFIYSLFEVDDDFNWTSGDPHKAGAPSWLWAIDSDAGAHMGAEEPDRETSLGMVDIWHWELNCGIGEEQGGRVSDAGDGDPGNDAACNFDDEWATTPEDREDDNGDGAENSLLGVFTHTDPTEDAEGTWTFEVSRPLQTGDEQDAEFEVGGTSLLAMAYWDPDSDPEGWEDDHHVQTSNQGFIEVSLAG